MDFFFLKKKEFSTNVPQLSIKIKAKGACFEKIRLCSPLCHHVPLPVFLLVTEGRGKTPGSSKVHAATATHSLPLDLPLHSHGGAREQKTARSTKGSQGPTRATLQTATEGHNPFCTPLPLALLKWKKQGDKPPVNWGGEESVHPRQIILKQR